MHPIERRGGQEGPGRMTPTRLKIVFLSNAESIHCRRWAEAMAQRGHDVHVITPVPRDIPGATIHVHALYPMGARGLARIVQGLRNVHQVRRKLRQLHPDLVHILGLFTLLGPDLKHAADVNVPVIVSTWGSDVCAWQGESKRDYFLKQYLLQRADALTATSEFQAKETQKYIPNGREVRVIPYGVDLARFPYRERAPSEEGSFTVGCVKRLEVVYGHAHLLDAFAIVAQELPGARLLLVGDGTAKGDLVKQAERLGVAARVEWAGPLPYERVPEALARMDLFVMPSLGESFGVAAVEAGATGLPVVASRVGGVGEVVADGETGLLVPPGDPKALANAILRLARDPALRQRMGKAARGRVERFFEWGSNVEAMERLYRQVVATSTAR